MCVIWLFARRKIYASLPRISDFLAKCPGVLTRALPFTLPASTLTYIKAYDARFARAEGSLFLKQAPQRDFGSFLSYNIVLESSLSLSLCEMLLRSKIGFSCTARLMRRFRTKKLYTACDNIYFPRYNHAITILPFNRACFHLSSKSKARKQWASKI